MRCREHSLSPESTMEPLEKIVVRALFFLMGVGSLWVASDHLRRWIRTRRWLSTRGTIKRVERDFGIRQPIEYEYEVDSRRLSGQNYYAWGTPVRRRQSFSYQCWFEYQTGDKCTVFYNPENPEQAFIKREHYWPIFPTVVAAAGLFYVCFFVER